MLSNMIGLTGIAALMLTYASSAATFTVAKGGGGNFTSIQEAIDSADAGDEIVIMDTEVYKEQVTIDSTRNDLTLRSADPLSSEKPVIRFKDMINIGPTTSSEALDEEMITFDRNAALQVLGGKRILIEGITIDGGGVYPFGNDEIWEARYALQHGNGAVTIWMAGDVTVRHCTVQNAYFGIYVKDRNDGGIYANRNPADVPIDVVPFSGVFKTGNHLIEHNRIHDNSFGLFFESTWDRGSTVRYNLIFENHHKNDSLASFVNGLTAEGSNQPGGAFMFKDHFLSPLAIYNNTLWHNALMFSGNWKTAPIHLIFNNIFAEPVEYWGVSDLFESPFTECAHLYESRMHNCVMAAQMQAPTPNVVRITNDMEPAESAGGTVTEGALVSPFPADADIRWVETPFLSTDPEGELFLEPDWSSDNVLEYILDKGWDESGVRDPDGTPADLGAVPMGGGFHEDVAIISPVKPVIIDGGYADAAFQLTSPIGTLKNPVVKMFGMVNTEYDSATVGDIFGANGDPVASRNITDLPTESFTVQPGYNQLRFEIPTGTDEWAFLELIIEGTGSDGLPFTSAVGFLPYRRLSHHFKVTVLDGDGNDVSEIRVGEPVFLNVTAMNAAGEEFDSVVDLTTIRLLSENTLTDRAGDTVCDFTDGISGTAAQEIVFTSVPGGGLEYVSVSGYRAVNYSEVALLGVSGPISILPDPSTVRTPARFLPEKNELEIVELIDLKGRVVRRISVDPLMPYSIRKSIKRTAGAGVYLLRKHSGERGAVTLKRCVVTGCSYN